jgi:hypothetical protein
MLLEYAPLWAPALITFVGVVVIFTLNTYWNRR